MAEPLIVTSPDEMRALASRVQARKAVVMTMGGLHQGHADLMDAARQVVGPDGHVTTTIFVNPLQFAASEDLSTYPRTFDDDVALCARHGVDVVFAPRESQMYPDGEPIITVDPGELGSRYEGVARPTHFRGVLTVVSILAQLTQPDVAVFGEKDYQQLTLVRRMAADLRLGFSVLGVPTRRESTGLAMSSRNRYLSDAAARTALRIPAAIAAGVEAASAGPDAVVQAAQDVLTAAGAEVAVQVEYVVVTDPLMGPSPKSGPARLIITAIVDGTRLLDNAAVFLGSPAVAEDCAS